MQAERYGRWQEWGFNGGATVWQEKRAAVITNTSVLEWFLVNRDKVKAPKNGR